MNLKLGNLKDSTRRNTNEVLLYVPLLSNSLLLLIFNLDLVKLANQQQFSTICTLIDHKNDVKMFTTQEEPWAAGEWFRCKGLNISHHFYGWWEYKPWKFIDSLFFYNDNIDSSGPSCSNAGQHYPPNKSISSGLVLGKAIVLSVR